MDCYSVINPSNGQTCNDDQLGALVFNSSDGTWEKKTGYTKSGNGILFDLNTLPVNSKKAAANIFSGQYGVLLIGGIVFVGVIVLYNLFAKGKK